MLAGILWAFIMRGEAVVMIRKGPIVMTLISLQEISLSFGGAPILEKIDLQIEPGERVCLVGRNGEGKSSLMKLISGEIEPDSGRIIRQQALRTARLSQEVPGDIVGSVYEVVGAGLGDQQSVLARHHKISEQLAGGSNERLLAELAAVDQEMANTGAWKVQQRIDSVLSRLQLDADQEFSDLSGGMKRRVLLGRTLVSDPELLLLDEPTNHLDIEAIIWLEEFLLASSQALLFVTHDRALLKKLATRIIDIERGRLTSWPGDYANYLRRKEEILDDEIARNSRFDKKLAQEEVWIRKGIKARRTRNEGRVRELEEMRRQRQSRREQLGRVKMEVSRGGASGKLVAVLKSVSFSFADQPVLKELSTTILRGDRIGIIGPNGVGKTTLLRLLIGDLLPDRGEVSLGTNLQPAYFDQQRMQLDPEKTVIENLGDGSDTVEINGRRRHLIGYLGDFLFTPDRARSPVRILSGGERNRLLLARLFAQPANILILDEPTNDLDAETLDLLEELLLEYKGTILLVSHDRDFLNKVVTSTLVFEGEGVVQEYAGGYDDWLVQRTGREEERSARNVADAGLGKSRSSGPRKLTFKETRELEGLPAEIGSMEEEQQQLYEAMADETFYQGDGGEVVKAKARLAELEKLLATTYGRWEELETVREEYLLSKG
jgi:ATP-binding cassette subfamily F protein uup